MVTREYEVEGFTGIDAGSAFEIEVAQGDEFHVDVTAEEGTFRYIEVDTTGSVLRLHLNHSGFFSFGRATLRARVTMPRLESLDLSGASRCDLKDFGAEDVEIALSGASKLSGELQAARLTFDLSGASSTTLEGSVDAIDATLSGASALDLRDAPAATAAVELSGASSARIDVSERLRYDLSGGSTLRYSGSPEVTEAEVSGGSRVSRD
ncbi:MAG: head GIN domain-containing protein [Anaerolineae bacterium]